MNGCAAPLRGARAWNARARSRALSHTAINARALRARANAPALRKRSTKQSGNVLLYCLLDCFAALAMTGRKGRAMTVEYTGGTLPMGFLGKS
jgi:hypothetical protein